jgi:hypothetical protein
MKTHISFTRNRSVLRLIVPLFVTLLTCSCWLPAQDRIEKYFIGIELNGILCGYSEVLVTPPRAAGTPYLTIDQRTFASFKALGQDMTQKQVFTYRIDPAEGNFLYHDSYLEQGEIEASATMTVVGDSLYLQPEGQAASTIYLPENTILPNTMFFPHLQEDFGSGGLDSSTYRIFNVRNGRVEDFVYRKVGVEPIELNDTVYEAVILEERDPGSGLLTTYWIDKDKGLRLKMETKTGVRMYLTDLSVMERMSTGNWDDLIFVRTNERIDDFRRISSMAVQADLDFFPVGVLEELNIPGQSFKGSIAGNSLEGIFEVVHQHYKGEEALSFGKPHSFAGEISMYLQAEEPIQSEDPEIKDLALKLTEGSRDFWEASCRLSSWVAENINGSVTGGSALETLHRGDGSCGAQSMLLAALCRASGIPARVVWGCVYTPEYGGSFGHHGWNEVYMGEAGWIPVDATMHESDYLDSGHIRLGELKTDATVINFREMKILNYASR